MLERVIENWLDKSTERSWQRPFCAMLAGQGHRVVHSTRHSAAELGVDVLSVDPEGTLCAYQLKNAPSGRIRLRDWRKASSQVDTMVNRHIVHPSVPRSPYHNSFFVTNGYFDEEVTADINDRNRQWELNNLPHRRIRTIGRGEMMSWVHELGARLWPSELPDIQLLLQLYLGSGRGPVSKEQLTDLLEKTCGLDQVAFESPSRRSRERAISSAALLCSIAIARFAECENHAAEIDAWTTYTACVLATADRWKLPKACFRRELQLASDFLYESLRRLCDELKDRKTLVEGDGFYDNPFEFYRIRVTWLLAMVSVFALWRASKGVTEDETDDFIRQFVRKHLSRTLLWGEAAVPQFLAIYWYLHATDATLKSDQFLMSLMEAVLNSNQPNSDHKLPGPYYSVQDVLPHIWEIPERQIEDAFDGSYTLEGIMHLVVRCNWKQRMKLLWPNVTRVAFQSFQPSELWHFYRWRNPGAGTNVTVLPRHTMQWTDLKNAAADSNGSCIPKTIKDHPILLLLFLIVHPHRTNASVVTWLDENLTKRPT